MKALMRASGLLVAIVALSGCMSSLMTKTNGPAPAVGPGKALVVFMRPSSVGGAIQASVYDTEGRDNHFIGVVSAKTKLAYQVPPGRHLFMVVAENADFMNADLKAGKTYHVLVKPRIGVWKARFSLIPIHADPTAKYSLASDDFRSWQAKTAFVVTTPAAEQWYREHRADITSKQARYLDKWHRASAEQRAELTLHAGDGM